MKKLKFLSICFALSFLFTANVFAQTECNNINTTGIGPSSSIPYVEGETISYDAEFSIPQGDGNCAIKAVEIFWYPPEYAKNLNILACTEQPRPDGWELLYESAPGEIFQPGVEWLFDCVGDNPASFCYSATADDLSGDSTIDSIMCANYLTDPANDDGAGQASTSNDLVLPNFTVEKVCAAPEGTLEGNDVPFTITITNFATEDMDFEVVDANDPSIDGTYLIAAGDSEIITANVSSVGACADEETPTVSNEVIVTAYFDGQKLLPTDAVDNPQSDDAECPVDCPPSFTADKECENKDPGYAQGTPADFMITIKNDGKTDLSCTDTAGELTGNGTGGTGSLPILLAPGETYTESIPVKTDGVCALGKPYQVENETTIQCENLDGADDPVDVDVDDICPVICEACFIPNKTCETTPVKDANGDFTDAEFKIEIENCGDIDLLCTDSELELGDGLSVGAMSTESELVDIPTPEDVCVEEPYQVKNATDITCTTPDGSALPIQAVSNECDVPCEPCIKVEKKCIEDALVEPGTPADFEIVITNCGDIPLSDIVIIDPAVFGDDTPVPYEGTLAPMTNSGPITLTVPNSECVLTENPDDGDTTEVRNAVRVEAEGGDVSAEDSAECECGEPCIEVEKVCTDVTTAVMPGDDIDFNIVIKNCGDTTLENIIVDDPAYGPILPIEELASGEKIEIPVILGPAVCVASEEFLPDYELETQENTVTVVVEEDGLKVSDSAVCPCYEEEICYQGCTPGYWKIKSNDKDHCWCSTYYNNPLLTEVYDPAALALYDGGNGRKDKNSQGFTKETLDNALDFKGGGDLSGAARKLLRHGTAALLNACTLNGGGNYPDDADLIIADINAALASQKIETIDKLKNQYGDWNEDLPCTIDANCRDKELDPATCEIPCESCECECECEDNDHDHCDD